MTTHVPSRATRTLLDADAVSRTLSRIAHELIERNDDLEELALVGIHTRGVPLAQPAAPDWSPSGAESRSTLGALDITFHRDDVAVRNGGTAAALAAGRARLLARLPARGEDRRARRRRALHRPNDSRRDRRAARVRAPRARPARRARRPRPPRAPDPARLRRQEPADGPRRAGPGAARRGRRGRRESSSSPAEERADELGADSARGRAKRSSGRPSRLRGGTCSRSRT